jgi:hypothetical protein
MTALRGKFTSLKNTSIPTSRKLEAFVNQDKKAFSSEMEHFEKSSDTNSQKGIITKLIEVVYKTFRPAHHE